MVQKAYGTSQKWGACPKNTTGIQKAQKQKYENTNENPHLPSLFSYNKKKNPTRKYSQKPHNIPTNWTIILKKNLLETNPRLQLSICSNRIPWQKQAWKYYTLND